MAQEIIVYGTVHPTSPHREFFPFGHEARGALLVKRLELETRQGLEPINPRTVAVLPFFAVLAQRTRDVLRYPADLLHTPATFGIMPPQDAGKGVPCPLVWKRRDAGDGLRWFLCENGRERPTAEELEGVGKVTLILRCELLEAEGDGA